MAPDHDVLARRRAGVLLHPTSLPGPFDFGVLGQDARKFIDFLEAGGFTVWQTLPNGPVDDSLSPYTVKSARAGNPRLIALDLPESVPWSPSVRELERAADWRVRRDLLRLTADRFMASARSEERREFTRFYRAERRWLYPFALFEALKARFAHRPWWQWPEPFRRPDTAAARHARIEERVTIRRIAFEQYLFRKQWTALKDYAKGKGIRIFGDLPIYVDMDSVEVWWHRCLFRVAADGRPEVVAGVPPDYFSEDGQLWGNPIYDWERMRADGFRWWIERLRYQLAQFDLLRIDHFRALESYWAVPGGADTAREGHWAEGPGAALLEALKREIPLDGLVVEDLGMITPAVYRLRDRFGLPGMLVLQFAFDGTADNPFLPERHAEHAVVYTGTHDNDTTLGWYAALDADTRARVAARLDIAAHGMPGAMVRAAYASPARLSIVPMQDILELGASNRMNTPGKRAGNWTWRFDWPRVGPDLAERYRELGREFSRLAA